MIYLDNSATTKLDDRVRQAMEPYFDASFGNASSIHSLGREAKVALEAARSAVAKSIGADSAEIVFTSGGTEANNMAISGTVFSALRNGKTFTDLLILTSPIEHHAVLEPIHFFESLGVHKYFADVASDGMISVDTVNPNLSLASVMFVNNEVGTINDITSIAKQIRSASPNAIIHSDAVQAFGKIPFDVHELGIDLLSLSAHKIHGPKGIGALYIRRGVKIESLLHGGSQERNRRGGTEAVALAVGFGEAARLAIEELDDRMLHIAMLRNELLTRLRAIPEVVVHSPDDKQCAPHIINMTLIPEWLAKLESETMIVRLDLDGIAVSNGAACTSGSLQPSHVLLAIGKGEEVATKSVRVSLSKDNSISDIHAFVNSLTSIIASV